MSTRSGTGGVADVLAPLANRIDVRAGGARTFAVRLWDGSELPPPGGLSRRDLNQRATVAPFTAEATQQADS